MSDSSLSNDRPSNATLERALRQAVQSTYKSGQLENLTVRRIRKTVEEGLDLSDGFFKTDAKWKDKSKNVIEAEVVRVELIKAIAFLADSVIEDAHADPEETSCQPTPKKVQLPSPKPQEQRRKPRETKSASSREAGSKKRRKKNFSDVEDAVTEDDKELANKTRAKEDSPSTGLSPPPEDQEGANGAHMVPNGHATSNIDETAHSESEMSELINERPKPKRSRKSGSTEAGKTKTAKGAKTSVPRKVLDTEHTAQSESEMSELIDEAPKPKRNRKSGSTEPKANKGKGSKGKKPLEEPTNPDTEEIKKLQGWLVKCGIRKMWFKELAPYDTSKGKIKHLKGMLADAGMSGRYSEAKAEQIREERELKADLEAVQAGDKMWGQAPVEEDPSTGRPKRRLARGLEGLDFLNDDDGEETD